MLSRKKNPFKFATDSITRQLKAVDIVPKAIASRYDCVMNERFPPEDVSK